MKNYFTCRITLQLVIPFSFFFFFQEYSLHLINYIYILCLYTHIYVNYVLVYIFSKLRGNSWILAPSPPVPVNPCVPSPCGPFSQCQNIGGIPSCSCLPNYVGSAPNCRPECSINSDCTSDKACIREKCRDPCPGSCGTNAYCNVVNHTPICTCPRDYTGDPFTSCRPMPTRKDYYWLFHLRKLIKKCLKSIWNYKKF